MPMHKARAGANCGSRTEAMSIRSSIRHTVSDSSVVESLTTESLQSNVTWVSGTGKSHVQKHGLHDVHVLEASPRQSVLPFHTLLVAGLDVSFFFFFFFSACRGSTTGRVHRVQRPCPGTDTARVQYHVPTDRTDRADKHQADPSQIPETEKPGAPPRTSLIGKGASQYFMSLSYSFASGHFLSPRVSKCPSGPFLFAVLGTMYTLYIVPIPSQLRPSAWSCARIAWDRPCRGGHTSRR